MKAVTAASMRLLVGLMLTVMCLAPRQGLAHASSRQIRPANPCPDNTWIGFQGGNVDINLFWEASGTMTFEGCPAADEPLSVPAPFGEHGVTNPMTIPAGTTATVSDSITVLGDGTLLVACTDDSPGDLWAQCANGPSAALDDSVGAPITVDGGTLKVAPNSVVYLGSTSLAVLNGGTVDATESSLDGPMNAAHKPGLWQGIDFQSGSTGNLSGVTIQDAGAQLMGSPSCVECFAGVVVEAGATVSLVNSTVLDSSGNGVEILGNGQVTLTGDVFSFCPSCGQHAPILPYPVRFESPPQGAPSLSNLSAPGYAQPFVYIASGTIDSSSTWPDPGMSYWIDGQVTIASGASLTALGGDWFLMYGGGFTVQKGGSFTIDGTRANPVTFTSYRDLSEGDPKAGDWMGIDYQSGSSGSISGANIQYGGSAGNELSVSTDATLDVGDSVFADSSASDVVVAGSGTARFDHDTFSLVPAGSYALDDQSTTGKPVVAAPDFWSRPDGPGGDVPVNGDVETAPYVEATVSQSLSGTGTVAVDGEYGASGSFGLSASGAGEIATDQLSGDVETHAPPGVPTAFFDARLWSQPAVTAVTVEDCDVKPGYSLLFYDGKAWQRVDGQSARDGHGCIAASLGSESPLLSQLGSGWVLFADGGSPTTTNLTASASSAIYGQPVTLTARVVSSAGDEPLGSVNFLDGSALLGSSLVTSGKASLMVSLKASVHAVHAVFLPSVGSDGSSTSGTLRFVVKPAPLTVTLRETIGYGDAPKVADLASNNPAISYRGLVIGDKPVHAVFGKLSCDTTATATSLPGRYQVTNCAGFSAPNYAISYALGTLWVNRDATRVSIEGWSTTGKTGSFSPKVSLAEKKSAYFEARLATTNGQPVSGRTLRFVVGSATSSQSCQGVTADTGVAVCKIKSLAVSAGSQAITITFAGDGASKTGLYIRSSTTSTVRVSA